MRAKRQTLDQATNHFQKRYLLAVLRNVRGNVKAAAARVGRNRTQLYSLLRRLQIDPAKVRAEANP